MSQNFTYVVSETNYVGFILGLHRVSANRSMIRTASHWMLPGKRSRGSPGVLCAMANSAGLQTAFLLHCSAVAMVAMVIMVEKIVTLQITKQIVIQSLLFSQANLYCSKVSSSYIVIYI